MTPRRAPCTQDSSQCDFWQWGADAVRPQCCTEHLRELATFAEGLLTRHGIEHWLDWGSLLGAVRDGRLIAWDKDVDFGVRARDLEHIAALRAEVREAGFHLRKEPCHYSINLSRTNRLCVDLYVWDEEDGILTMRQRGASEWPGLYDRNPFGAAYLERPETVALEGTSFPAPSPVERFLVEHRYGPGYMTPTRALKYKLYPDIRPEEVTPAVSDLITRIGESEMRRAQLRGRSPLSGWRWWRRWGDPGLPDEAGARFAEPLNAALDESQRGPATNELVESLARSQQAVAEMERLSPRLLAARERRRAAELGRGLRRAGRRASARGRARQRELPSRRVNAKAKGSAAKSAGRKPVKAAAQSRSQRLLVRSRYGVHSRLGANAVARRRFRAEPPQLNDAQARVVSELQERGIATVAFDELVADGGLWAQLSSDMATFAEETEATLNSGKVPRKFLQAGYLVRSAWRDTALAPASPWLRLAAEPRIVDTVNAFRGMWTKLMDLERWYTVPTPDAGERVASQNWHRDPEDLHVIKVFTYFVDVDEDAGPFQYIAGSPKGGPYGDCWPWQPFMSGYPPQAQLRERTADGEVVTATGTAGTVIFCDTSGFHRGGFARLNPRVMSYQTYVSPASLASRLRTRRFTRQGDIPAGFSEPSRFALD